MAVRVLIAEDDEDIRGVLKRYLEAEGYECDEAGSLFDLKRNSQRAPTTFSFWILCFQTVLPWKRSRK